MFWSMKRYSGSKKFDFTAVAQIVTKEDLILKFLYRQSPARESTRTR